MRVTSFRIAALMLGLAGAAALGALTARPQAQDAAAAAAAPATERTRAVAKAARAFLATLAPEQRAKAALPFVAEDKATGVGFSALGARPGGGFRGPNGPPGARPPLGPGGPPDFPGGPGGRRGGPGGPGGGPPGRMMAGEKYGRAVWSNFPVTMVARPGLRLGDMTVPQREAALHLLQVLLSPAGYRKVQDIMSADQVLADAGQDYEAGRDVYSLAILGEPDPAKPWMVEFNGHHLGLNVVVVGAHGVMTPTLTGTQPAEYPSGGKTVRVLAGESDKAFALLQALRPDQRSKAVLGYEVRDLVMGPGHDGETLAPEGLRVSEMTDRQKALLMEVAAEWAGIVDAAYAAPRLEEIKAGLNDTWFAWSGPTTHAPDSNGAAYYRLQGPKLLIEFAPQSLGGDPTMHVHTVYRDPTNEYGRAYTRP